MYAGNPASSPSRENNPFIVVVDGNCTKPSAIKQVYSQVLDLELILELREERELLDEELLEEELLLLLRLLELERLLERELLELLELLELERLLLTELSELLELEFELWDEL